MAIAIHVVKVTESTEDDQRVLRVVETAGVASSNDAPTVEDYLVLEAAAGFLVNAMTSYLISTVSAANINAS